MGTQVWSGTVGGRTHRVEADDGLTRAVRWSVDGELAAQKRSTQEKVRLEVAPDRLEVRFSPLGAPRRATVGGVDLVPEPGSRAARHEEAVGGHPERYALIQAAGGAAKVVLPILLTVLLARFALSLPLPSIDGPDLPSLPLPDLPDLPDWSLPGWVEQAIGVVKYVWPVVLAYVLARSEINRRRRQDEERGS
ncbi:hypothetical protein GON03_10715 [Nocardioides sp. MAH-18]|uniref:Uncharacterized protein n=1 Tax=Nocardioides agri TaxID=2682843 RepID=A0A6L6XS94_9ACTN|nr:MULTISPECIES: hypothetical protein [unclassified Nocardioides]MBA2954798.1 hypothetical protein [Nocardioides sp. CGMCC 1.13656]MVQ49653.1 hypothetical protein [Nocardioides sp. MAH-18]